MKDLKNASFVMVIVFCAFMLVGCGKNSIVDTEENGMSGTEEAGISGNKKQIVCTIFPIYDWIREILGEDEQDYELVLLMESGSDLHNYQPTVMDMARIAGCDLFFYVGGESDAWVGKALSDKKNPNRRELSLLDALGQNVLEEEGDHAEHEADEHIWLSLKNAQILVKEISKALEGADVAASERIRDNSEKYLKKLENLDEEFEKAVEEGRKDTLLFCDRFPFRYLAEDYGLNYYAAFSGCGAEADASFETIAALSDKMDELGLDTVLVLENTNQKVAETVVRNTKNKDQKVRIMDSMQSSGGERIKNGETYLSVMEDNLETLRAVLK